MSKKENIQQEEKAKEQAQAVEHNEEANASAQSEQNQDDVKKETSVDELIQVEKDKYLRLFAEFENYKKRTSKERIELFKTAGKDIIVSMLPVIDDFDRAMVEINKSEDEELVKGVV
ncbi:nucleotide exchange factor GrpE, partial [Wenyingzhuangia sp.]